MKLTADIGEWVEQRLLRHAAKAETLLLRDIAWPDYGAFLELLDEQGQHLRTTYDRGSLEVMTLSPEHEGYASTLALFLQVLAEECEVALKNLRSMTIRREDVESGLEPDNCFYSQNYAKIRGKKRIDLTVDPPPDLAIEIDITRSSLNRMAVYAQLRVRELWRFDGRIVKVYRLAAAHEYEEAARSELFPGFAPADFATFLLRSAQEDDATLVPQFRAWVRQQLGK